MLIDFLRSFWTLTGSPSLLKHPALLAFAQTKKCTPAQAVYRLAQLNGVTPLSGTTNESHMEADLEVASLAVDEDDRENLQMVANWMGLV